jgi:hypothetical protein
MAADARRDVENHHYHRLQQWKKSKIANAFCGMKCPLAELGQRSWPLKGIRSQPAKLKATAR